ncbi:MAG: glycosyltransferase [Methanocorpusculum sp.]|nr:glycosyltransferase [Methanocorpusculum sp.]
MERSSPVLSIAIPVYKDAAGLRAAVPRTVAAAEALEISFEILLMEDGGDAACCSAAQAFAAADARIQAYHSDERRGKGGAITEAAHLAHGDIFCFFDVDLSTDLKHLKELVEKIQGGADVVIGSRMMKDSVVIRTENRERSSRAYNLMVRALLGSHISDNQCGFKGFRRDALLQILPYVSARGWTWDTEVLAFAVRAGFSVVEIPVVWTQGERTNVQRSDIFVMARDVVKLAWRIRVCRAGRNISRK